MHSLFELRHVCIQTKIDFLNTHKTIIDSTFGLFEKKYLKKTGLLGSRFQVNKVSTLQLK
jgi:hypothetical protein